MVVPDDMSTPTDSNNPAKGATGKSSGLTVREAWVHVFEENQRRAPDERMTDEQISEYMKGEFPDMDSVAFDRVTIARGKYNRGGFHKKDRNGKVVRPKVKSVPHGATDSGDGGALNPSRDDTTAIRGRMMSHQRDFKSHKK